MLALCEASLALYKDAAAGEGMTVDTLRVETAKRQSLLCGIRRKPHLSFLLVDFHECWIHLLYACMCCSCVHINIRICV
jgi:hypothetical protein